MIEIGMPTEITEQHIDALRSYINLLFLNHEHKVAMIRYGIDWSLPRTILTEYKYILIIYNPPGFHLSGWVVNTNVTYKEKVILSCEQFEKAGLSFSFFSSPEGYMGISPSKETTFFLLINGLIDADEDL